tara:strand:+ start:160 stop:372 length:213 start_codon:yes stop_codon:yes gene_type:complete
MTIEQTYVKHIECGIRAIKLRTKSPHEANVGKYLNKLREVNDGLCDDLMERYEKVLENYKKGEEKFGRFK